MANNWTDLKYTSFSLCGLYAVLTIVPVIQIFRILRRVPDFTVTIQKVFLFLCFLASSLRVAFFGATPFIARSHCARFFLINFRCDPLFSILDTLPTLIWFSTYTLLLLYYAETINRAQNSIEENSKLRPAFYFLNFSAYLLLIVFWVVLYVFSRFEMLEYFLNIFIGCLYILAALGFLFYGGGLFCMLRGFPISSRGKKNSKMMEVGLATIVATFCFLLRAILLVLGSIVRVTQVNPVFIGLFYFVCEIVPAVVILYLLRKLPTGTKKTSLKGLSFGSSPVYPPLSSLSSSNYPSSGVYQPITSTWNEQK